MSQLLYVVQKIDWQDTEFDSGKRYAETLLDYEKPAGRPLAAFRTRAAAEEFKRKKERKLWARWNPFDFGDSFKEVTTFEEGVFRDWVFDLTGLRGPEGKAEDSFWADGDDWQAWWIAVEQKLTAEQREKFWEQMDLVELFRIVELPVEE